MQHVVVDDGAVAVRTMRRDAAVAAVLALILSTCWLINDWGHVGRLILPDADDMMRLAQVRDWIGGQGINDWTQYRMAPPLGAPMHWSRVNDFGLAGIIVAATPLIGRHAAELTAVILYPGLLFACYLLLSARIARRLWGAEAAPVAIVLAALAYPGTTLFIPGRIDHHALQVVLIQLSVLATMRRASVATGIVAGTAVALSLVIGLEAVPQLAALVGVGALLWVVRGATERARLAGFAGALAGVTLLFLAFLRPTYWSSALCDAFTPATSNGTLAAAAALGVLAAATPWLRDWRVRLAAGAVLGGLVLGATLHAYPSCLTGPYGQVSPFLRRNFITHIDEANSIFRQQTVSRAIQLAGLMVAATITALWMVARRPRRWPVTLPIALVVAVSALVTLGQVRGTYIGAPAAGAVMAGVVLAARRRLTWRVPALVAAWLASAGVTYMQLPMEYDRWTDPTLADKPAVSPQMACNSGDTWALVDRYPPGIVMAPTNMASYMIGATHMATVGAGYHRNDRGNMAMYRYFLGPPAHSPAIARAWHVTYVAFCPGDFSEIDVTQRFPHSLATMLTRGRAPADFVRLPLPGSRLRLYRLAR